MSTSPVPPARVFIEAARPRTLPAGLAPVVLGVSVAIKDGASLSTPATFVVALGVVVAALAIQIGTNYANDYFDFKNGADTAARVGPRRATQAGLVTPAQMARATVVVFLIAAVTGAALVLRGGWPILAIGASGLLMGVLYTGGPRPLGYLGLGDILVFIYFGPAAVWGTHLLLVGEPSANAALWGVVPGLLSVAILVVNNLRDRHTDVAANKRTLAVRFGATFARVEYALCVGGALLVAVVADGIPSTWDALLPLVALPVAVARVRAVATTDGPALNPLLGKTAGLLLLVTILTAVGLSVGATPGGLL